jgi:hypothetical protein
MDKQNTNTSNEICDNPWHFLLLVSFALHSAAGSNSQPTTMKLIPQTTANQRFEPQRLPPTTSCFVICLYLVVFAFSISLFNMIWYRILSLCNVIKSAWRHDAPIACCGVFLRHAIQSQGVLLEWPRVRERSLSILFVLHRPFIGRQPRVVQYTYLFLLFCVGLFCSLNVCCWVCIVVFLFFSSYFKFISFHGYFFQYWISRTNSLFKYYLLIPWWCVMILLRIMY